MRPRMASSNHHPRCQPRRNPLPPCGGELERRVPSPPFPRRSESAPLPSPLPEGEVDARSAAGEGLRPLRKGPRPSPGPPVRPLPMGEVKEALALRPTLFAKRPRSATGKSPLLHRQQERTPSLTSPASRERGPAVQADPTSHRIRPPPPPMPAVPQPLHPCGGELERGVPSPSPSDDRTTRPFTSPRGRGRRAAGAAGEGLRALRRGHAPHPDLRSDLSPWER